LIVSSPAPAATVSDPVGDFIPSFTGTASPDLDVTSFSVDYVSLKKTFLLGASLAGPVNLSTAGLYVIGVNTGTGTLAPFAGIGEPNVTFNQAIAIQKNGSATIGQTALPTGSFTLVGNVLTGTVPLSLLPSTGAAPANYGFNLWPRTGLGNNNQITDFAPQNALLTVAAVPEVGTWAMLLIGLGGIAFSLRRMKTAATRTPSTAPSAGVARAPAPTTSSASTTARPWATSKRTSSGPTASLSASC